MSTKDLEWPFEFAVPPASSFETLTNATFCKVFTKNWDDIITKTLSVDMKILLYLIDGGQLRLWSVASDESIGANEGIDCTN